MTYLSPELANLGYTGVTGTTPYQPSTVQQVATLKNLYANALDGRSLTAVASNAIQININFDGTQNNRDFPAEGEAMTNIGQIAGLQAGSNDPARDANTIYMRGIGAQTSPDNSPNNLESTPWKAGEIGNQVLETAYFRLKTRIAEIRDTDPDALIALNLTGFSRGGAEAVAFANLLNERGIPGLYSPGNVPVNSLVLFDPVSRTDGALNVNWPTNLSNPALVFVASAENRIWFPAMPVDTGAIVVPIEAVHADVGGSFNPDGISAVTLKIARDYLTAVGSPMDAIPADLQPNWGRMYIHNSAIDNYNNLKYDTIGEPTQTVGTNRYYEGTGLGSLTVQDMLGRDINVVPVYEARNGGLVLVGFVSKAYQTTTDEATGNVTETRDIIAYARDGKTITARITESVTKDDTEKIIVRSAVDYAADGLTIIATRSMEWLINGNLQTTTRDRFDNLVSVGKTQTFDDGSASETVRYTDGRIVRTNTDATGSITSRTNIQYFEEDGSSIETVHYADGRVVKLTYNGEGNLLNQEDIASGGQTLQNAIGQYGATIIDVLSLIKAIQSGEPLPILVSGLRLANDISPNLQLSATANAVSSLLSLMALDAALERGDALGAITAGAQAVSFGAEAYARALEATYGDAINVAAEGLGGVYDLASGLGKALPALNLINAIANGDEVGAAIAGLQVLSQTGMIAANSALGMAIPYIGWAYAVYSLIDGLFGGNDIPDPWGSGQFVWDGSGVSYQAVGETGGDAAVGNVMQGVLATMNALIERVREQNPGSQLGLIAQRMPAMAYDMSGYRYTSMDPLTGVEKHPGLRFDTAGHPYNAEPGSPESYQSIVEAMVRSALERGAIAPQWEVRTAQMQTAAGDPRAGLTEEERAARDAQLAAPVEGQTQRFRPVVLDLDGDGVETTAKADGVAFDVDDSGYLKQTGWVKGDDGILVLDRNYNGQFDSGKELFSNAQLGLGRRGLGGMAWVDANHDGKLTEADPVWSELKLWRDLNQDGDQDVGEVQGVAALGVSELNYAMGTFTQNGVKKQLASPDLEADKDGTRVTVVPEGILVQSSRDGRVSLLVTRIDDKTAVQANRDGVTAYEDVELIVSAADLLANDTLGGIAGRDLNITGLTNFRHGTGFIDANGFIHFTPEPDYAGSDAGFDYVTRAANGQTGNGTVDVTLQNVNDAPTLDTVSHESRPIYGYTPVEWTSYSESGSDMVYTGGGHPIYEPYGFLTESYMGLNPEDSTTTITLVMNPAPGNPNIEYHTTPLAYEDRGTGRVIGRDADDPASSLVYELVNQPQYGAVSLNPDGTYQYTSWKEPGVSSDRIVYQGQYAATRNGTLYYPGNLPSYAVYPTSDMFQVRITDPSGASVVQSITVPHYGPYLPPTPEGGGGKKPIAVDLDGNGFEFVNVNDSNVFFDMNGDGWRRRTSWVAPSDGLLAYDIDGDGKIDKAGEISFARYKDGAQTDLEGLAAFDTNGDGVFNAGDDKWRRFGVWQDANQNGITDAGEFRSLDDLGITGVRLRSDGRFQLINGQTVHGRGAMMLEDGGELAIADVALAYSNEVQAGLPGGATTIASPFSPSGEELNGTEDKDLILGKNGNNIVNAHGGDDLVFEDGGNDVIDGGAGNDLLYAGADNDLVLGGAGEDVVYAGLGDDMVFGGDGHDAILAEGGNDVVFGGAGNDLISGGWGNDVLSGDDGNDQVFGESGNDALFGRAGDDELHGMDGGDLLDGGDGNDWLDGGAGADRLQGGAGDDTYVLDDMADAISELADGGTDTVRTALEGYALGAHLENLALLGDVNLNGSGNALDNRLTGNRGSNRLWGGAGSDRLDGGLGADTLIGGAGDDIYVVDDAADVVVENVGEGTDTVRASVSHALAEQVENLTLTGLGAISASGNALDNMLTGNAGDNLLDGGLGADTMAGGRGDDSYWVDEQGDVVVEQVGEGIDTVMSRIAHVLGSEVENLVLVGAENLQGTGNALDNVLRGNAGHNRLDGGLGADTLFGAAGDDSYVVDSASDQVLELAGEGTDTVLASVSHTLAEHVENLVLTGVENINGEGNELDNQLVGNAGDNLLDGGLGADAMAGGAGDDSYHVDHAGDLVIERAAGGVDTVISSIGYVLPEHVEHLALAGKRSINGTGNDLDNSLIGNAGDNVLDGGLGADAMTGGAGDDSYVVDSAADQVLELAGEGMDTVLAGVSHALAEHVENLTLTGSADIAATGNALDNRLVGNTGHNLLEAGRGNDSLRGGLGDDRYVYRSGDGLDRIEDEQGTDTVVFGAGLSLDKVALRVKEVDGVATAQLRVLDADGCEQPDQGLDFRVERAADGQWVSAIERFQFADGSVNTLDDLLIKTRVTHGSSRQTVLATGRDDDIIHAGPRNEVIRSGSGHDVVFADPGSDAVYGEGGDDYLQGSTGDDLLDGGCGIDLLSGANGADRLQGGGGNDVLFGGQKGDLLEGGDAHDFLAGGRHDDSIRSGAGHNVIAVNRGDGRDTVYSVAGASDTLSLGAGIREQDLAFARSGVDLVLMTDGNNQVTFKDWYAFAAPQTFVNLQLVASVDNTASGWAVDTYDFQALVRQFDAAQQSNAKLSRWSLMSGLLDAHLASSDSQAWGGELAVRYAAGGESAVSLSMAHDTLAQPAFGQQAQGVGSRFNPAVAGFQIS